MDLIILNSIVCSKSNENTVNRGFLECGINTTLKKNIKQFNIFLYNSPSKRQINSVLIIINVLTKEKQ